MNENTILAFTAGVTLTFIVEEIRAYKMLKEFERRLGETRILQASLDERLEMLEE